MKKVVFILSMLFCGTIATNAQTLDIILNEKVVTLSKVHKNKDLQKLANDFERIAIAKEEDWLAQYYTAYVNVRIADQSEGDVIDNYCDRAEKYLRKAEAMKSDKSEIYALYAYLYSSRVKVSPMMRGPKMGKIAREYAEKSIKANPNNPRPYLIRAIGIYLTPTIFGGGKEKAMPLINKALEKFNTFKPATKYSPNWGKNMLDQLLK